MYRFYIDNSTLIDEVIHITGSDVNHIKNVLRMKKGEKLIICNGQGQDYYCIIDEVCDSEVIVKVEEKKVEFFLTFFVFYLISLVFESWFFYRYERGNKKIK